MNKIKLCLWHESGKGWFWDDSEDHGGFDRISPNGPFEDCLTAMDNAQETFNQSIEFLDEKPYYYPENIV